MDGLTGTNERNEKTEEGFVRIQWNRKYECGNQIIDTQHKKLFQLSNELLVAMLEPQEKTVCEQLMEELIEEIAVHFNTEESIIEAAGYPEFREHREIHKEMLALASDIIQGYKADNIDPEDVFNFLAVHIVHEDMLEEDRKFFAYV